MELFNNEEKERIIKYLKDNTDEEVDTYELINVAFDAFVDLAGPEAAMEYHNELSKIAEENGLFFDYPEDNRDAGMPYRDSYYIRKK